MVNMRNKILKNLTIIFALVLIGLVVLYAFPVEADKSQVEFEASLTAPAGTYQYKSTLIYVPADPESVSYVASFSVPSGEIVRFQFLDIARFELWQEGIFEPDWVVGNEGSYGIGISSQFSKTETLYLVVLNDVSSSSQDVKVWLSRTWHESSKLGLASGSTLISSGIAVIPLLFFGKSKLNLKYSATLFAMAFLSVFNFGWAPYWSIPPNPINNLAIAVPGVFFFEAFPLIALLYLLEKNNGFAYFKSWNMKQPLRISGMLLFSGYTFPIFFMLVGMFNVILRPMPLDPYKLTVYSLIAGGSLMVAGLVIFVGLWASNHRRNSLSVIPNMAKH
jgi:hypothetical protein